ncbi:MAG: hypothetical protein LUP95_02645 [Euryarchaeota archaeon]|nr:hypothetical protein [Euryarchaeota archaeon]
MLIEIAPYLAGIYDGRGRWSGAPILAVTMIPEGFQEGGKLTALVVLGFAFAAVLE